MAVITSTSMPIQARIDDFPLSTVEIKKESDPEIRFDLFERLNTGATSLNDQELRNCVYRGEYNQFLRELARMPIFGGSWVSKHRTSAWPTSNLFFDSWPFGIRLT